MEQTKTVMLDAGGNVTEDEEKAVRVIVTKYDDTTGKVLDEKILDRAS